MDNLSFRAFSYNINKSVAELNDVIDYHDLTVCIKGKMTYEIDGKKFCLANNDWLYIAPFSHRVRYFCKDATSYVSINVYGSDKPLLSDILFNNMLDEDLIHIIKLINLAYKTRNYDKFIILTQYILCDLSEKYKFRSENPTVLHIKNYILQNIHKKLSSAEVAAEVFLSKGYCETLFRRETGKTISTFINSEKINSAKNLLSLGEYSLSDIAAALGFDDYNYFSRVFKQYTNLSPIGYRKQNCSKNNTFI